MFENRGDRLRQMAESATDLTGVAFIAIAAVAGIALAASRKVRTIYSDNLPRVREQIKAHLPVIGPPQ